MTKHSVQRIQMRPIEPWGGGGGTLYNGQYGEAPLERGDLFRLEVCKR